MFNELRTLLLSLASKRRLFRTGGAQAGEQLEEIATVRSNHHPTWMSPSTDQLISPTGLLAHLANDQKKACEKRLEPDCGNGGIILCAAGYSRGRQKGGATRTGICGPNTAEKSSLCTDCRTDHCPGRWRKHRHL